MRRPRPPVRPVLHPLRPRSTAQVESSAVGNGRRRITIHHAPLRRVTPQMLRWWFEHIEGTMDYGGTQWPRYLVWHPLDHIHWSLSRPAPGGGAGEGARFHIVERMGANPDHHVDSVEFVEKLDDTGIRLTRRVGTITVFSLEHTWIACGDHTHYFTEMNIGAAGGRLVRPVNAVVTRLLPEATAEAWITHNIEEVGHLDDILPMLHALDGAGPQGSRNGPPRPAGSDPRA